MTSPDSLGLFVHEGDHFLPTPYARGPWRPDALHGAAVAGLLGGLLVRPDWTPVRTTFDLFAPVPFTALRVREEAPQGGRKAQRRRLDLYAGDRLVARASCLEIRQAHLDLPEATRLPNLMAGVPAPDLTSSRPAVADRIGWQCFDSHAVSVRTFALPDASPGTTAIFVNLLVPVIAGEPTPPYARVVAAADYASNVAGRTLPYEQWTFLNADLTVHVTRPPHTTWIALVSAAVLQPNGAGLSNAMLLDANGQFGQAIQSLVLEHR